MATDAKTYIQYTQEDIARVREEIYQQYCREVEQIHTQYRGMFSKYAATIKLLNKLLESEISTYDN